MPCAVCTVEIFEFFPGGVAVLEIVDLEELLFVELGEERFEIELWGVLGVCDLVPVDVSEVRVGFEVLVSVGWRSEARS